MNDHEKKLSDTKENLRLYNHFLEQLTIFLNNYHERNYSKKYWSIIFRPMVLQVYICNIF